MKTFTKFIVIHARVDIKANSSDEADQIYESANLINPLLKKLSIEIGDIHDANKIVS